MNALRPLITPRGAVRALSAARQPTPFLATRQLASKATGRNRGGMTRLPPPLPPPPPRPSTSAADGEEWTNSQARTDSLWQNEKWALITFVATAPIFYGMFWYVGILDRYNPMDEFSKEERRGDQLEEEIRAEARANVEAQWGAGAKPEPDGQGSDVSDCSSQPRRQLPLWPGRRRRASLARGAAQIPGGRSPSCGTTTAL